MGLLNVLVNADGNVPEQMVTGQVIDVSPFLEFHYWEEVFCDDFPSGNEQLGHWCGPANKKGDILTYWILLNDSGKLVTRSNVRRAKDPLFPNCTLRPDSDVKPINLKSVLELTPEPDSLPKYSPADLVGMTFLWETDDDQVVHAKIVHQILD